MYYSPCHAGCKKVSEILRNGKKVCLKALCIIKGVAYLWSDLAGSAEVSTGLSFAANRCKSLVQCGCFRAPPGIKAEGTLRLPCFASLSVSNRFCQRVKLL